MLLCLIICYKQATTSNQAIRLCEYKYVMKCLKHIIQQKCIVLEICTQCIVKLNYEVQFISYIEALDV